MDDNIYIGARYTAITPFIEMLKYKKTGEYWGCMSVSFEISAPYVPSPTPRPPNTPHWIRTRPRVECRLRLTPAVLSFCNDYRAYWDSLYGKPNINMPYRLPDDSTTSPYKILTRSSDFDTWRDRFAALYLDPANRDITCDNPDMLAEVMADIAAGVTA
jgi:hypothetical protein